jgi:hypothetical protein
MNAHHVFAPKLVPTGIINVIISLLSLYLSSCKLSEKHIQNIDVGSVAVYRELQPLNSNSTKKAPLNINDYVWKPHHSPTANYLCELHFKEDYVAYFFKGRCVYLFNSYAGTAGISPLLQLQWNYKKDCSQEMSFLEQGNGLNSYPKEGDVFASYSLVNDSTLGVEYKFPKWAEKVNEIAHDSIFPQRLYIKTDKNKDGGGGDDDE